MSAPPPPPSNSNTPAAPLPPSLGAPDRSPPVAPASPPVMPSGSPPSPPAASPPAPPDPPPVTTPPVAPLPTLPPPTPPPVMPVPVVPAPSPPAPRMPSKPVKPVQPSSPPPVVQPPSPSPPLTPQPPTLSPPPPVMPVLTPTPSPPSPVNPLPPTPSPPPPVNPLPPTTSPPSPVNALPPAPSPPSPVNPLPPTTSPPSPVNPLPPAPSSPPSPAPPTTPSQPPAAAPSPTTTPPPNPLPPAGSPPAPSPATPIPSPPVFTASPPGGATPSPPASTSPPSRSSPPSSRPSPRSPPPSSTPQGVVIAIVAAIVALLVLGLVAGLLCFCSRRRRLRRRRRASAPPDGIYRPRLPVTSHQQSPFIEPIPYTPQLHAHSPLLCSSSDPPPPPPPPPPQPSSPPPVSSGTVSYADLEAATNGFSEGNLLGQGGFGHVYHGKLLLHGREQEVAIKKLRPGSGQGEREFRAEVGIISRVHHRNLVSLVGYCIHNDQRLLIYEYVPNKTLDYHLHGRDRTSLDWARRWKIAVGSAKGLAYLHEDCRPKIIHRDIKAANILLDFKFEPKVADFGLAKIQPGDDTHVSTRVMGTFGYLAPEYATTGKVNDRSDVFSFGVVLLELITGRRPVISTEPYNDETLVSWARPLLTKALEEHVYDELVDPKLGTLYDAYDMQRLISCAAAAVRHTARSRPRMTQIVRYLEGELSIEDLNAGVAQGQSSLRSQEHSGDTTELMQRRFRKVVFPPGTGAVIDSDYLSEVTSEYGVDPSISSSSGGDDDSGEVVGSATVTQTATSRPHAASIPDTAELAARHSGETATAKPMSRRTRPSRLP